MNRNMFDRIFVFVTYTCFAFMLITAMDDLGRMIGFEQMGVLGISIVFGFVYSNLTSTDSRKRDKEEEKDGGC